MKFTINSKLFKGALEQLSPAYNPRAVIPVLLSAKVEVMDGSVEFTMTDLQTTIKHKVECSTKDTGVFLLPFKEAKNISGLIDAPTTVEWNEKNGVVIRFDSDVFNLGKTESPDAFPVFPKVKKGAGISVDKEFFGAIRAAARSAARDSVLDYVLSHVCVEISKDSITTTGANQYGLFTQSVNAGAGNSENTEILIPHSVIPSLGGLKEAEVFYNKKYILFVSENTEVCVLLGDGKYPNWRQGMPMHITNLSLDINDLIYAVNKSFAIGAATTDLRLQPKGDRLEIKTEDNLTGTGCNSEIPCKSSVSFDEIKLSRNQLLGALKQLSDTGGQDLEISMPSPNSSVSIKVGGVETATALIQPILSR